MNLNQHSKNNQYTKTPTYQNINIPNLNKFMKLPILSTFQLYQPLYVDST